MKLRLSAALSFLSLAACGEDRPRPSGVISATDGGARDAAGGANDAAGPRDAAGGPNDAAGGPNDAAGPVDAATLADAGAPTGKRIFVTGATFDGNLLGRTAASNGAEAGDDLCRDAAQNAGLGSSMWRAWISVAGISAIDRIADVG